MLPSYPHTIRCPLRTLLPATNTRPDGYQVANRLNRFALGDRDKLSFAPDGSLTFYIQPDPPGGDKDTNWLPTPPAGKLSITMRLYVPKAQVRDGRWAPPPIKRVA